MRTCEIMRRRREAQEGIAACQAALSRFPGDPTYSRSLRIWETRAAEYEAQVDDLIAAFPPLHVREG